MNIFDITRPLSEKTFVYPGDCTPVFTRKVHAGYRTSEIRMGSHSGTHIDAPAHCAGYSGTIDTVPLSSLLGRCRVIDVMAAGPEITASHLAVVDTVPRILLKTGFSVTDTNGTGFPGLSSDAARFLIDRKIECIGIDSPSIGYAGDEDTVHHILLGHGCIILEFLDLSGVPAGDYLLAALPLRLEGLDGSPARVVLFNEMEE